MYSKLASRNIKRSLKDYTIYFITLIFGVCIFYTFNSIGSQQVMLDINEYKRDCFKMIEVVMSSASVFISFILAFLIIYANRYLIRRRKKEFGIYMTLGMEKGKISKILFIETIFVGLISLAIGLVLGIFLSQGLSIVTAKMFQVDLKEYNFIFSKNACIKTCIYFGIIYFVVLLFNSISIGKIKLIDLITASEKNERAKVKNIWISFFIFITSVFFIGSAYYFVLNKETKLIKEYNLLSIILGCFGTFLFFFSLTGFLLKLVQSNKKNYLKDLNMFVLRQISSKINTTFISMTFISLLIFVSICTLSGGFGISKAINSNLKDLTKFDASLSDSSTAKDIKKVFDNYNLDINTYSNEYVNYCTYKTDIDFKSYFSEEGIKNGSNYYPIAKNQKIPVMKVSDFNKLMNMLGEETISLKKGEYAAFGDIYDVIGAIQESLYNKKAININGTNLVPSKTKAIEVVIYNQICKYNICTFIVEDSLVEELNPYNSFLNMTYKGDKDDTEKKLVKDLGQINDGNINMASKNNIEAASAGIGVTFSYLAIYIGIIFLITATAILALQQLSESADNIERYKLLKKIGVDDKMVNKSILMQTSIYFLVPLSLALIHSIVGLKVSSNLLAVYGDSQIEKYVMVAVGILIIIYGGYFVATYNGAKKIIKG